MVTSYASYLCGSLKCNQIVRSRALKHKCIPKRSISLAFVLLGWSLPANLIIQESYYRICVNIYIYMFMIKY